MKVLLTGEPGIGKSTIVTQVVEELNNNAIGILGKEIRDLEGQRVGFEAVNLMGESKLLSHKSLIKSDKVVGNKYHVNETVIDNFIVPELQKGLSNGNLIVIDEIGRMQAFSNKFLNVVNELLNTKNNFLGTIVVDPEPWSIKFKEHSEVVLINVTTVNRDYLVDLLVYLFKKSEYIAKLNSSQQKFVQKLLTTYFSKNQLTQISKLLKNAIHYVLLNKVEKIKSVSSSEFKIKGDTDTHFVKSLEGKDFICDCDLFKGEGKYKGKAGECSHIQAVKLFLLAKK